MNKLEEMIKSALPNCGLRDDPHIESRIKHWSEKYSAMAEMLALSGFGWDVEKKMLQPEKVVFNEWAKAHKKAKGLYGVPFPYYEMLAEIYAKDKATRDLSESFVGAIDNMDIEIANNTMTIDSDGDYVNSTTNSTHSTHSTHSTQSTTQSLKHPMNKDTSESFGKIFEDINANLGTMANAWSKAEEREQKMDEKVNKVLEEVMKLDGISPSEALEVATILMAEEHKLRIFYQAPSNLKKQYVLDLLKKNRRHA
ncbi:uncharacterized protein [Spinacia oleracea]|uniref:Myb/SANT-like domain-containing protein n=1 Tax=Spinacia oleracea TaxID=3562 RepID=A0ABM3QQF8_SPIOL|nr:uncharacterized protein LOC130461495 [Spinacia oleracea]